ncbi:stage V sporulation protein AA [Bacillus fonticola]|uniref:stage V sporulation protein AA n=1 Tax=Bacillus fonticola TaxID=2728853 RepID=UPI0014729CB1|nr:stage V sporulation protein AA [Bacillus fonticola]
MSVNTIYIRLRHKVQTHPQQTLNLGDVAQVIADDSILSECLSLPVVKAEPSHGNIYILDVMTVVRKLREAYPNQSVDSLGTNQTIIEIISKKKPVSIPLFLLVWGLLFVGASLAIMNFHEDVSMGKVHQKLYTMMTGEDEAHPLLFQIPYSLGLGVGMVLFFNHLFRKRINEEPSPLEVEMFNYQQDLDRYVAMNENKESIKRIDDH